jgi:hypothetical protein
MSGRICFSEGWHIGGAAAEAAGIRDFHSTDNAFRSVIG